MTENDEQIESRKFWNFCHFCSLTSVCLSDIFWQMFNGSKNVVWNFLQNFCWFCNSRCHAFALLGTSFYCCL